MRVMVSEECELSGDARGWSDGYELSANPEIMLRNRLALNQYPE
jgi:hypothetical protein